MDLLQVMRDLYASEINCGMESFWDGQWTVWIGDFMNGRKIEEQEVNAEDIAATLDRMAREVCPHSDYAKRAP